jgi:biopolymer transport protein ExbD
MIRVTAQADGPPRYQLNGNVTSFDELRSNTEKSLSTRQNRALFVQADPKLNYGQVAAVLGEVNAAGAAPVSLMRF